MFADAPPTKALIEGGKVRALGVTTLERVPALPDVPPLAEVGIPGYNTASWHSISTAAGCRRTSSTSSHARFTR
jgi:tripartite-type tricarboxylate transporter receptor subunit TctC